MKAAMLALAAAFSLFSFGQNKKISFMVGDEYKPPLSADDLSFFGDAKDGLINVYSKNAKLTIVRFNPTTLAPFVERTIELPDASKNFNSERVVDLNGKYYWLHNDWDKDGEKEWMSYNKIDVENGKLLPSAGRIIETTRMGGDIVARGAFGFKIVNKYAFNFSAGNKRMLVSYRLHPEKRRDKFNYDNIGLHLFDENMNKLWGGEFSMPYTEAVMDNDDFTVDNLGNVYMLAKVYSSDKRFEKDKETGKPGYHYEVLKFEKGSKRAMQISLPANDNFINNMKLLANDNNDILITGVYTKAFRSQGYEGIFLAVLDQQNKISQFKNGYYPFIVSELAKYESAHTRKKIEKDNEFPVPNLRVRSIIAEADGSTVISLEQFHVDEAINPGASRDYSYFYYDDIFTMKISENGLMEWFRKIPKRQWGNYAYSLGYKLIPDATGYCFLYLDNEDNLNLAEDEEPKKHVRTHGGQVMLTHIDLDGKVTKEIVFDIKDEGNVALEPTDFKPLDDNHFIGRVGVRGLLGLTKFKPLLITIDSRKDASRKISTLPAP